MFSNVYTTTVISISPWTPWPVPWLDPIPYVTPVDHGQLPWACATHFGYSLQREFRHQFFARRPVPKPHVATLVPFRPSIVREWTGRTDGRAGLAAPPQNSRVVLWYRGPSDPLAGRTS